MSVTSPLNKGNMEALDKTDGPGQNKKRMYLIAVFMLSLFTLLTYHSLYGDCVTSSCSLNQDAVTVGSVVESVSTKVQSNSDQEDDQTAEDIEAEEPEEEDSDDTALGSEEEIHATPKPTAFHDESIPTSFDKPRLVIVTSLGKAFQSPFRNMFAEKCGTSVRCRPVCNLNRKEFLYPGDLDRYLPAREDVVKEFQKAAGNSKVLHVGSLYSGFCDTHFDSVAFPPSEVQSPKYAAHESTLHPDLADISRIAQEAGIDLRILVVLPKEARTVASKWSNVKSVKSKHMEVRALETQVHNLFGMLFQLDQSVYRLYDSDSLTMTGSGSLDEWLGVEGAQAYIEANKGKFEIQAETFQKGTELLLEEVEVSMKLIWKLGSADSLEDWTKKNYAVEKTVFSTKENTKPKLIYYVGLEGTGHHLWSTITTEMIQENLIVPACSLQKSLFNYFDRKNSLWHSNTAKAYEKSYANSLQEMELLVLNQGSGNSTIYAGNVLSDRGTVICKGGHGGMMSYPNYGGVTKNLQRPSMISLARLAEKAGVDLRIIVLFRSVDSIIGSTVDHRHFAAECREIHVLQSNGMGILAQLAALDSRFITECAELEDTEAKYLPAIRDVYETVRLEELFKTHVHVGKTFSENSDKVKKKSKRRVDILNTLRNTDSTLHQFCPRYNKN